MKAISKPLAVILICFMLYCLLSGRESLYMLPKVETSAEVLALFPTSPADTTIRVDAAFEKAEQGIAKILEISPEDRTFKNTLLALDRVGAQLGITAHAIDIMNYVHPDAAMREAAQKAVIRIQEFSVDNISANKKLYAAVKEYAEQCANKEKLNAEEQRYLKETLKDFEKSGLGLPEKEQEEIKQIQKESGKLALEFGTNINTDNRTLAVPRQALAGLDEDFIAGLKQDDAGNYLLGTDGPTVTTVLQNCAVESTRRDYARLYSNRAYPVNTEVIKKAIALKDRKAELLGYESFAHLNLEDQMAKTPEKVKAFLDDLAERSTKKVEQEMALFKNNLPEGVFLTKEGQFKPWDLGYVMAQYKKHNLELDEEKIKEYFPMQHTIDQLLDIYSQFFGITFKQEPLPGLWHQDVRYIKVYQKDGSLLGHLLLDLHPRDNKYTHACACDVVPAWRTSDGELYPAVALVIANFPKPQGDKPALLNRRDVETFFHEFGHALHVLFGATQMIGFSGFAVAHDFVEVPSQMLEEWLYDKDILKKVSKHYRTGEPLSDAVIEAIQAVKRFDSGYATRRQVGLARFSLACYEKGAVKNPADLRKQIFEDLHKDYLMFDDQNNFEASFGHLLNYYARYYCYYWSLVYAVDMFEHIKKFGLLNPAIGQKYAKEVLGKGGSVDANDLLKNFLGREPSSDAFFKSLGL